VFAQLTHGCFSFNSRESKEVVGPARLPSLPPAKLPNDTVHLPGRLQGRSVSENRNAGPVKCNALLAGTLTWET
jgi:hypothetical protein